MNKAGRLPWMWDEAQFDAVRTFLERRAHDEYCRALGLEPAKMFAVTKAGTITAIERMRDAPRGSVAVHAYALPRHLEENSIIPVTEELIVAGDVLLLLNELRSAISKGNTGEAAQIVTRLWISTTVAGWTAGFYPLARKLIESQPLTSKLIDAHDKSVRGASAGGRKNAESHKERNDKIRAEIIERLKSGKPYTVVIAALAKRWPAELGSPLSGQTLRNKFPQKTFPTAGANGKA